MKKIYLKVVTCAVFAAFSVASFAQTNLGSECGCPDLGSRTPVILGDGSANGGGTVTVLAGVGGGVEFTQDVILTCDKIYTLNQKVFVPNGKKITIMPGTVIKGAFNVDPASIAALIIERGGKIFANGTENCPIVMTSADDPMNGTYSKTNVGRWGGLAILGIAPNNLTIANKYSAFFTTPAVACDGVGFIEGFNADRPWERYGAGANDPNGFTTPDVNDNSGVLRYLSIRHAGALVAEANELNGLSLGSVGAGTTIEHVEVIASADDNIEVFGGTVNLKYISTLYGDDDMLDYDLGWKGKVQFYLGVAGDSITGVHSTDNGIEADGDDDAKAPALRSHPVIYNSTFVGNGHVLAATTADNSGPAGIQAKDLAEGEIYNSIFANFRSGLHLATSRSATTGDAYDNWKVPATAAGSSISGSLIVKNNTFIAFGNQPTWQFPITKGSMTTNGPKIGAFQTKISKLNTAASADDNTQFTTTDGNSVVASVNGFDNTWSWNAAHTAFTNPYHYTPLANITSSITPPTDGFFTIVNFRGAFDATKPSWISTYAFMQMTASYETSPTDINKDGTTNVADLNMLLGKYGTVNP